MDFVEIKERIIAKTGSIEIYPEFKVRPTKDLMTRGKDFYAIWDEERSMWSTDLHDVQRLVDNETFRYLQTRESGGNKCVSLMTDYDSGLWDKFVKYVKVVPGGFQPLDENISFSNSVVTKKDYVSKKLPYSLYDGSIDAYNEMMNTLYSPDERDKLEWAIGAIFDGAAKEIHKFIVLYGEPGTGKSTIINIIESLFSGYYVTFDAKALGEGSKQFAMEVFRDNPLIGIQHDGDLSRIDDNTRLNSITSHEYMSISEKYKASYTAKLHTFLIMGTNKPVKITDSKSGIIRRLIDVHPTGNLIPVDRYYTLVNNIQFELGAIANYCIEKFRRMGKSYYNGYVPRDMMMKTDVFFNFVDDNYYVFKSEPFITLNSAYEMYKNYCTDTLVEYKLAKYRFREELKTYFEEFQDKYRVDGKQIRSCYIGFITDKFNYDEPEFTPHPNIEFTNTLMLDCTESILDEICKDYPAQYATKNDTPSKPWAEITTTLADIKTSDVHYMRPPINHIIIDFDIKVDGKKSIEKNMEAASKFPPTYAEISKGGNGIHLHYYYTGDPNLLSRLYDEDIEIKIFSGLSSLRRRVSKCNNLPIATIGTGLPLREEKTMVSYTTIKNEKALRTMIQKAINLEVHPNTRPNVSYIRQVLDDAYASGIEYDVSDLAATILSFAHGSTNQAKACLLDYKAMKFKSDHDETMMNNESFPKDEIVFYDVEVFTNVFIIAWKRAGGKTIYKINPTIADIEELCKYKLVGFNCRRYDNHILYAKLLGYTNYELYELSQRMINDKNEQPFFREAYNLSYTDILDFSSKKQSLKKFEIELGLTHIELGHPWDEDLPEDKWIEAAEYCCNDVEATEAVFHNRQADFVARKIIASLSGLSVNHKTSSHVEKYMFGNEPNPQKYFNYPDLSKEFPGYKFEYGKSTYKGHEVGEGGLVLAIPGVYGFAAVLDIDSMHPSTIIKLQLFGPYTVKFEALVKARIACKKHDYETLNTIMDGALAQYVGDDAPYTLEDLSYALKIIINSIYGLTAATYPCKFKDPRNIDNVVAKRGALFMVDLWEECNKRGYAPFHIKTDSIKFPNITEEIVQFVNEFGAKYGYSFTHENTYDRICLINNAVYIAYDPTETKMSKIWSATGAQFKHPYVHKTLFTKEPVEFEDLCETKSVKTAMYLDMNEKDISTHDLRFIGKVSSFCPIIPGAGGGALVREATDKNNNIKYDSVTGTKDYRWLEAETVKQNNMENMIDMNYFDALANDAIQNIETFMPYEQFINIDVPIPMSTDIAIARGEGVGYMLSNNPYTYDNGKDLQEIQEYNK